MPIKPDLFSNNTYKRSNIRFMPAITFPGPKETENRHFPDPKGRSIFSLFLAEIQASTVLFSLRRFLPLGSGKRTGGGKAWVFVHANEDL